MDLSRINYKSIIILFGFLFILEFGTCIFNKDYGFSSYPKYIKSNNQTLLIGQWKSECLYPKDDIVNSSDYSYYFVIQNFESNFETTAIMIQTEFFINEAIDYSLSNSLKLTKKFYGKYKIKDSFLITTYSDNTNSFRTILFINQNEFLSQKYDKNGKKDGDIKKWIKINSIPLKEMK